MDDADRLHQVFLSLEVNSDYTEATVQLRDASRLTFCHRVGERWARALGATGVEDAATLAATVLQGISQFRLNGKHLDVFFADGSRWEYRFARERL